MCVCRFLYHINVPMPWRAFIEWLHIYHARWLVTVLHFGSIVNKSICISKKKKKLAHVNFHNAKLKEAMAPVLLRLFNNFIVNATRNTSDACLMNQDFLVLKRHQRWFGLIVCHIGITATVIHIFLCLALRIHKHNVSTIRLIVSKAWLRFVIFQCCCSTHRENVRFSRHNLFINLWLAVSLL